MAASRSDAATGSGCGLANLAESSSHGRFCPARLRSLGPTLGPGPESPGIGDRTTASVVGSRIVACHAMHVTIMIGSNDDPEADSEAHDGGCRVNDKAWVTGITGGIN